MGKKTTELDKYKTLCAKLREDKKYLKDRIRELEDRNEVLQRFVDEYQWVLGIGEESD